MSGVMWMDLVYYKKGENNTVFKIYYNGAKIDGNVCKSGNFTLSIEQDENVIEIPLSVEDIAYLTKLLDHYVVLAYQNLKALHQMCSIYSKKSDENSALYS